MNPPSKNMPRCESHSIEVKRLGPREAELAGAAIRRIKQPETESTPSAEDMSRFLSRPQNLLIVASSGDQCLGFLLAYVLDRVDREQPMVCLYEIGVSKRHRRTGVGRAMIEVLKGTCEEIDAMKIWAVTNRSNEAAVALYERTGARSGPDGDEVVFVWNEGSKGVANGQARHGA